MRLNLLCRFGFHKFDYHPNFPRQRHCRRRDCAIRQDLYFYSNFTQEWVTAKSHDEVPRK